MKSCWIRTRHNFLDPLNLLMRQDSQGLAGFCDATDDTICAVLYVMWGISSGLPYSRILMAKCRVLPLLGSTIPCSELQSLVILHHLAVVVLETYPARFCSFSAYTDSMSSIGALAKSTSVLKPYFANRISEIKKLQLQVRELSDKADGVHYVPGSLNHADLGTRGTASLRDLGIGSVWQSGPKFLTSPYQEWPRDSPKSLEKMSAPVEEVRAASHSSTLSVVRGSEPSLTQVISQSLLDSSSLGDSLRQLACAHSLLREARAHNQSSG